MKIQTKYFGEIEIEEGMIIEFPEGVLGFPNSSSFVMLEMPDNPSFKFLQDVHNSYVSFLTVSPWDFFKDYEMDINDEELAAIGIAEDKDKEFSAHLIVTLGKTFEQSTANLLAPIMINITDKLGKQFILEGHDYGTKHKLLPEGSGE